MCVRVCVCVSVCVCVCVCVSRQGADGAEQKETHFSKATLGTCPSASSGAVQLAFVWKFNPGMYTIFPK